MRNSELMPARVIDRRSDSGIFTPLTTSLKLQEIDMVLIISKVQFLHRACSDNLANGFSFPGSCTYGRLRRKVRQVFSSFHITSSSGTYNYGFCKMELLEKRMPPYPLVPDNGAADHSFPTTQILFMEIYANTFISQSNLYYNSMRGSKSALCNKAT